MTSRYIAVRSCEFGWFVKIRVIVNPALSYLCTVHLSVLLNLKHGASGSIRMTFSFKSFLMRFAASSRKLNKSCDAIIFCFSAVLLYGMFTYTLTISK